MKQLPPLPNTQLTDFNKQNKHLVPNEGGGGEENVLRFFLTLSLTDLFRFSGNSLFEFSKLFISK